jgi:AcrR family transcriptional regulator
MARVVKRPEERRHEFIHAADELFREKGYFGTSIDDIIQSMGVAKGLFYYYFDSKEDLMKVMVLHLWEDAEKDLLNIVEAEELTAIQKFFLFSAARREQKRDRTFFLEIFEKDKNSPLFQMIREIGTQRVAPMLSKIIKQGVDEGVFDTEYPDEAAEFLLRGSEMAASGELDDPKVLMRRFRATLDMWERIIGAEKGTFDKLVVEGKDIIESVAGQMKEYHKDKSSSKVKRGD